jgi:hypothetical protein
MILQFFYLSLRLCASGCGRLLHRILQRFILGQSTTARSAFEMVNGRSDRVRARH